MTQNAWKRDLTPQRLFEELVEDNGSIQRKSHDNDQRADLTSKPVPTNETKSVNSSSNAQTLYCTYHTLQYCHPYIRNILLLYTGVGGWVFLGIIMVGTLLQIHFMVTGRNTDGHFPLTRRDLKYEIVQMKRNKKSSFMTKWAAEMSQGGNLSLK